MISKALRPAHQRSEHLKRISHHYMSDARDSSTDEQDQHNAEETLAVLPGTAASTPDSSVNAPAGEGTVEEVNTTKTDKNSGLKKANKAAKAGKEKKSPGHHKEVDAGKDKKSRKHDKVVKAGKGKKSRKKDKKIKTPAIKPEKPGETGNKKAAVEPLAAASGSITAAQANPAKPQPMRLALIPSLSEVTSADSTPLPDTVPAEQTPQQDADQKTGRKTEPSPSDRDPDLAVSTSGRHTPLYLILGLSLIALYGLWGYHHWSAEHGTMKTASTPATIVKPVPQQIQPVAAVPQQEKDTPPVVTTPAVKQATPPGLVATNGSKPEPAAAMQPASKPVAPLPRTRFRPPAYGRYAPGPAWQRPLPYYRNYPRPSFRQPLPRQFIRDQRTIAKDTN